MPRGGFDKLTVGIASSGGGHPRGAACRLAGGQASGRGLAGALGSAGTRQSTAVAPRGNLGRDAGGGGCPGSPGSVPILPNSPGSAEEGKREDFCLKRQKRAASGWWQMGHMVPGALEIPFARSPRVPEQQPGGC